MGAEDGIDPRSPGDDAVAHLLGEASADRDLHPGTLALDGGELAEVAKQAGRGVFAHGAGVDDDDVGSHVTGIGCTRGGFGDSIDGNEAGLLQQARHAFGIVFVHLAAERAHRIGTGQGVGPLSRRIHRIQSSRARSRQRSRARHATGPARHR